MRERKSEKKSGNEKAVPYIFKKWGEKIKEKKFPLTT